MERSRLLELMEDDREMIFAGIARDRSPAAVQTVLEKAIDRLMLRASEQYRDVAVRDAAQLVLSSLKSALPLVDSVGEVRRWRKTAGAAADRRNPGVLAWIALAGGAMLALASVIGLTFAGGRGGLLTPVRAVIPVALGLAGVFWSGAKFAKPARARDVDPSDVRDEYLVDADKLWHHLRGMLLVADSALDSLRGRKEAERQRAEADSDGASVSRAQVELFAGLLESLYAQDGAAAREMSESIRFFLHGEKVDVVDFEKGRENWFEFLPAQRTGTIRPALVADGRLIKKGMASA